MILLPLPLGEGRGEGRRQRRATKKQKGRKKMSDQATTPRSNAGKRKMQKWEACAYLEKIRVIVREEVKRYEERIAKGIDDIPEDRREGLAKYLSEELDEARLKIEAIEIAAANLTR